MPDVTHVLDVLPAYALGSLDTKEAAHVKEHLRVCPECRAESDALEAVTAQLAFAAPSETPSPGLRDRLMRRIELGRRPSFETPQSSKWPWLQRLLPIWGLLSLFLIFALTVFNLLLWQRLDQLEFATAPGGMRAVPLSASQPDSDATGFVIVSGDGDEGALVVDGLPPLDEGWQYQLWLIRDGQRTSGAVFSTDEKSYGGTRIKIEGSLLEYSSVGVTIEPAGGSLQPTGTRVLAGQLFAP